MTQEMERNLEYLQNSLLRAGFGDLYNEQLKTDMAAGKAYINFPFTEYSVGEKEYILFRPSVVEKEDRPGFYIFPDIHAGLYKNEKMVASINAPHYKMTGMTVPQIATVLKGGVVLHTEGEDGDRKAKQYFSMIDPVKPTKEGQPSDLIRVPAKNHDLARLISSERFMGRDEEKTKVLADLQNGLKADVTLQKMEGGKYPKVSLQLALIENKEQERYELALRVTDREGTLLRTHRQDPKAEVAMKTSLKLQTTKETDSLSGTTLGLTTAGAPKTPPVRKTPRQKI